MRILVVTHNYPRFAGDPAGAFVARLAEGMAQQGHDVRVVAPHAPGTLERETRGRLSIHRFRYAPDRLERVAYGGDLHDRSPFSPATILGVPLFLLAFRAALKRVVRDWSPDVVHAHWWIPGGWLAVHTAKPTVITCHGSDVRLLDRGGVWRRLGGRVLARARAITTVSRFLADDVARVVPEAAPRLHVLPMPLDVDAFTRGADSPKASPPQILYAGNLLESKGVADLIAAMDVLRSRGVSASLKVLGEGPARRDLQRQVAERGLDGAVHFADFVSQDRMPSEYGASTVTVLPTRGHAEGLGLTLVEALLAGSAVVGTAAGGIPEVVRDRETGLLARGGDPSSLADCIDAVLRDAALRERLSQNGRAWAREHFSTDTVVRRYLTLYHDVTDDHHAR